MKYLIIPILLIVFVTGCEMPQDLNVPGDNLKGYVTHIDTNLVTVGGFYSVSIFDADSSNPFHRVPVRTDSMTLCKQYNRYWSFYSMSGIGTGHYYIAATWSSYPKVPNEIPKVLGTYGCDTSASCTSHTIVMYPNFQGNFRNITSWTDPGKKMN